MDIGSLTFDNTQVVLLQEPNTVNFDSNFYMPEFSMKGVQQSLQL